MDQSSRVYAPEHLNRATEHRNLCSPHSQTEVQEMVQNLQQLRSSLWEAANILRGSAVDRTDWKGYILPLLFFKRISDVWDEEHALILDW